MQRILVIEDDRLIRENVAEILRIHNFNVRTAGDGFEGLKLVDEFQPDLVISDLAMEGIDGCEVLRTLRRKPDTRRIPFIFLTAFSDRNTIRAAMNDGADDYVVKPFSISELLQVIGVWVDYRRSLRV
ncbi:MAG TPA: response regulator [Phototrophicaceae bacterium]|jgi:CheY-like chemotaxis protein|nr:response regulator [Phototrophicaceae bacterium]